jgi:uncharacterized protein (TIRG00374 family)
MKEVSETSVEEKNITWPQRLRKQRKNIVSGAIFLLLAGLTFYAIFHGNDMNAVAAAAGQMNPIYLLLAILSSVFFICAEGMIIWYLMYAVDKRAKILTCMRYSFIGFFFSGITPSASGGQPAQIYYMNKEGMKLSECTVVLMTVATLYKFVLAVIGLLILLFAHRELAGFFGSYIFLYYLGLALNVIVVAILLLVMVKPKAFQSVASHVEKLLVRLHLLKPSSSREEKLNAFVSRYQETVAFFLKNKHRIVIAAILTALQRISVFVLTYFIYLGFAMKGSTPMTVIMLQAAVYVAVEIMPLPGAQGITELMYRKVFAQVFPGSFLTASMCVTRSINFYFVMIISAGITLWCYIRGRMLRKARTT